MAVIFNYQSTQTQAFVNQAAGGTMGQCRAQATAALAVTNVSSEVNVFGSKYLAKASTTVARAPIWPGFSNTPSGTTLAAIVRIIPRWTGTPPTVDLLVMSGNGSSLFATIDFIILATGAFRLRYADADGNANSASTASTYTGYVSGTAVDIMFSWDGTTNTNALKFSVEGSEIGTATPSTALISGLQNVRACITCGGGGVSSAFSNFDLNEIVIFDNAQSDTYTPRSGFWTSTPFDGSSNTDPGQTNVRLSTGYTIAGVAKTGSAAIPTAANVRSGVATDATTGTLAVPSANDVRNGVAIDAGTGNLVVPIASTVKQGVTYDSNSSVTGTYVASCDYPVISNVKLGVAYSNGTLTGTYNPLGSGIGFGSPHLTEKARFLIMGAIKANIATELTDIRTDRADNTVTTEPPVDYFIYSGAHTYQCPAVFVVVDSGEVPDETTQTNYVSGKLRVFVSVVVEGQNEKSLTIKCERYQSALFKILHQTLITDTVDNVKIYTRCKRFQFSELYTKSRRNDNMGEFRKEVALELEVKHWENPTK